MYADDLTLYGVVKNLHDASLLQYDLQAISEYAKSWLLDINLSICKVMHVGNLTSNYYINDALISVSTCEKIVGVFPDENLSSKTHIFRVVKNLGRCVIYYNLLPLIK